MKDRLKHMKQTLLSCVERELGNMSEVDTKELGEVIDMIKDLEETLYYCTITEAMESKEEDHNKYYPIMYYPNPQMDNMDYYRDMDKMKGRMYYSYAGDRGNSAGGNGSNSSSNGSRGYMDREYMLPLDMRDQREGRSPMSRKGYMEGKEMHLGKEKQMKELEKYMQELTSDITEMIQGSSPEEKQLMQKKIATLAEKVGQINV